MYSVKSVEVTSNMLEGAQVFKKMLKIAFYFVNHYFSFLLLIIRNHLLNIIQIILILVV